MTKKRRKPLDDTLAEQFVYGEDEPKAEQPPADLKPEPLPTSSQPATSKDKISKELSLMEKLQVQPKEVTKRFTVDLPETMHRSLSILAARTGRSKADIVRLLLQDALKDVQD
jgi:flagellar motor switch protein FliM